MRANAVLRSSVSALLHVCIPSYLSAFTLTFVLYKHTRLLAGGQDHGKETHPRLHSALLILCPMLAVVASGVVLTASCQNQGVTK
jgi:hypothetical protein